MRPAYHFTPDKNWINDPNGMVYFDGEWHLFYQYNPYADTWGHMHWGHAVTRDLAHWEHLPIALYETPGYMIYSGSAAVDWRGDGGFGARALVAAFTAHSDGNERQHLAYSTDRGRTWREYDHNPVVPSLAPDFRDPKLFWHEPTQRWVMVVSLAHEKQVIFYTSADLRTWQRQSSFGPAGAHEGVWECPDFFPLAVDGDPARTKWILKVDDGKGIGNGSGAQYFVGDFDGTTYTCDDPADLIRPIDFGCDFYAAQSWSDAPDGRRVWLAWMTYWAYANKTPTSPWRGMMSLPRELSLKRSGNGLYLAQQPAHELQALRKRHWHVDGATAADVTTAMEAQAVRGTSLEINIAFDVDPDRPSGLKVRTGAAEETLIGYDPDLRALFVDRSASGQNHFSPQFEDRHSAPFVPPNGRLALRVFVDGCSVEVFAAEGGIVISELVFPAEMSDGVGVFGDARNVSLDVWELAESSERTAVRLYQSSRYRAIALARALTVANCC